MSDPDWLLSCHKTRSHYFRDLWGRGWGIPMKVLVDMALNVGSMDLYQLLRPFYLSFTSCYHVRVQLGIAGKYSTRARHEGSIPQNRFSILNLGECKEGDYKVKCHTYCQCPSPKIFADVLSEPFLLAALGVALILTGSLVRWRATRNRTKILCSAKKQQVDKCRDSSHW